MRNVARVSVLVLATVGALMLLWWLSGMLLLLLIAITIATLVAPAIRWLHHRGMPRLMAIGVTYGALGIVIGGLLWAVSTPLIVEFDQIVDDVEMAYRHIVRRWPEGDALQRLVAGALPELAEAESDAELRDVTLIRGIVDIGGILFGLSIRAFLTVVVSIYWTIDYHRIERLWLLLLPLDSRVRARRIWHQIQDEVGMYMRSELLQGVLAGVILVAAFSWSGFPYPVMLATVLALTWLVPWLGPVLAVVAIWTASLLSFRDVTPVAALARAAVTSGFTLLVFAALEFLVEPRLADRRRYSSLLVMLLTVTLIHLVGVVGLFLGPPVTIAVQILAGQLLYSSSREPRFDPVPDLGLLRQRLEDVRGRLDQADGGRTLTLKNIQQRLDSLLNDASTATDTR